MSNNCVPEHLARRSQPALVAIRMRLFSRCHFRNRSQSVGLHHRTVRDESPHWNFLPHAGCPVVWPSPSRPTTAGWRTTGSIGRIHTCIAVTVDSTVIDFFGRESWLQFTGHRERRANRADVPEVASYKCFLQLADVQTGPGGSWQPVRLHRAGRLADYL